MDGTWRSSFSRRIAVVIGVLASLFSGMLQFLYHPGIPTFQPQDVPKLSLGLNVVVTGANSGLGYETVKHLVQASNMEGGGPSLIVMACRSMTRCEAAKQQILKELGVASNIATNSSTSTRTTVLTMQLDLQKRDSIQRFAIELPVALNSAVPSSPSAASDTGNVPIDVLVNNAGVFTRSPSGVLFHNDNGTDEHILINHLGHVLLMHYLWPKLLQDKTRIVAISSISALLPIDTTEEWVAQSSGSWTNLINHLHPSIMKRIVAGLVSYGRSKRANMLFAHEIHRRYSHLGISAVASHPGIASTNIWTHGGKIFPRVLANFFHNSTVMSQQSNNAAATQIWAALDRANVPSGWYVGPRCWCKGIPVLLGPIVVGNTEERRHRYLASPHFWPFAQSDGEFLFNQSLKVLKIAEFGRYERE
jgi:NAD(P)-dependent dehydrogenase (short-subunit alcohol dehydrogenase family)